MEQNNIFKTNNINFLTPENCTFSLTEGGLLFCEWQSVADDKKAEKKKAEGKDKKEEDEKPEGVVKLHRAFPFRAATEYISVFKADSEIGIIRDLKSFDDATQVLLNAELARVYFSPVITKIESVKERYGFSYWEVVTNKGKLNFAVTDTYRSILKLGNNRLKIIDQDANRYEITDMAKLDKASIKMLEMYI